MPVSLNDNHSDIHLRRFKKQRNEKDEIDSARSPHEMIRLTRQATTDPEETIDTVGQLSNKNDYKLKTLIWFPFGLSLFIIFLCPISMTKIMLYYASALQLIQLIVVTYPVLKAKKLRSFKTLYCRFEDFADIVVPYGIKEYPSDPVRTVSELMAMRGTYFHLCFTQTSLAHFVFVALLLMLKKEAYVSQNGTDGLVALICCFIGAFGGWTATTWELDDKDMISTAGHYLGVIFVFIGSFASLIETNYNTISVGLVVIATVSMINFVICGDYFNLFLEAMSPTTKKGMRKVRKTREEVHNTSVKCICSEAIALYSTFLSISYFLYNLEQY